MTEHPMTCDAFADALMAYLEHETDDATRAAADRHAVACAECGALLADVRKLRASAAKLPELKPSRDLWSGIAARIEAPVVPIGSAQRGVAESRPARGKLRRGIGVALMAASLVAAAGIGYMAAGGGRNAAGDRGLEATVAVRPAEMSPALVASDTPVSIPAPSAVTASAQQRSAPAAAGAGAPATAPAPASGSVEARLAVARLTADYDREIAQLRTLIERRRNQLDPVTVAIIEKNLMVIDTAIVESKKAIARDPASRFLIEALNQSLQSKVELMRTVALLPSRT